MPTSTAPTLNTITLAESYRICQEVARKRAKNFYYSFLLLERQQRASMCAIYAFMRECDDLSDDPEKTGKSEIYGTIAQWRIDTEHALHGDFAKSPIWPAFFDTVTRYKIPHRFFHEMIEGITSDIEPQPMQTFKDLYRYCYQVASVVGLTIIHIFGFESQRALLLAEKCGIAFQLTNILRDVREDALLGRLYLPLEDLERFGVKQEQLRTGTEDEAFRELMRYQAARARTYFLESEPLMGMTSSKSRPSLWALREIYTCLLDQLEANQFNVLRQRLNVRTSTKLTILAKAFWRRL